MFLQHIVSQHITKPHLHSFIITEKSNNFIAGFRCVSHKKREETQYAFAYTIAPLCIDKGISLQIICLDNYWNLTNNQQPTTIIILWHLLRYTGSIESDSASHIGQQKADIEIGWKRICNHVFVCISAFFWCFLMFFWFSSKKKAKKFGLLKLKPYLCNRYPEYNLFTLKKLIPIEIGTSAPWGEGVFLYT